MRKVREKTPQEIAWDRGKHAGEDAAENGADLPGIASAICAGMNQGREVGVSETASAVFAHRDARGRVTPQNLGGGALANPWLCGTSDPARLRRNFEKITNENCVVVMFNGERKVWNAETLNFEPVRTVERYAVRRT